MTTDHGTQQDEARLRRAVLATQAEAIARGEQILANAGGGELRIHGTNGQVRDQRTVAPGNDPRNRKG